MLFAQSNTVVAPGTVILTATCAAKYCPSRTPIGESHEPAIIGGAILSAFISGGSFRSSLGL